MKHPTKRGRQPLFTSAEVLEIQQAEGTLVDIAKRYRASRATIARIRSYAYEYSPVDVPDKARTHPVDRKRQGRRLDPDTLYKIAHDMRPQKIVAEAWGISKPYVANLRAKYGTANAPTAIVHPQIAAVIISSDKSIGELADQFALPRLIVQRIRDNAKDKE
jgi:hypothetical protein